MKKRFVRKISHTILSKIDFSCLNRRYINLLLLQIIIQCLIHHFLEDLVLVFLVSKLLDLKLHISIERSRF